MKNLHIGGDINWIVLIQHPGKGAERYTSYKRDSWKRLTAITHARWLAKRYPNATVHVLPNV